MSSSRDQPSTYQQQHTTKKKMVDAIGSQIGSDLELWKPDSALIDYGGCLVYNYENTRGFNSSGGNKSAIRSGGHYMKASARDKQAVFLEKQAAKANTEEVRQTKLLQRQAVLANPLIVSVNEVIRICKEKECRAAKYYKSLNGQVQFHARRRGYNMDFHEIRKEIQKDREKMANNPSYRRKQKGRICMVVRSDIELTIPRHLWGQQVPVPSWAPTLPSISEEGAASGNSSQPRRAYVKTKPLKEAIWAIRDADPFAFGGMDPEPLYQRLSEHLNVDPSYFTLQKTENRVLKLCQEALDEPIANSDDPEAEEDREEEEDGDIEVTDGDDDDTPNAELSDTMNEDVEDPPADAQDEPPADAQDEPPADAQDEPPADVEEDLPDAEDPVADTEEPAPPNAEENLPVLAEDPPTEATGQTPMFLLDDPITLVGPARAQQLTNDLYQKDTPQIVEAIAVQTPRPRPLRICRKPVRYQN